MLIKHAAVKQLLRLRFARCFEVHSAERLVVRLSERRRRERNQGSCRESECCRAQHFDHGFLSVQDSQCCDRQPAVFSNDRAFSRGAAEAGPQSQHAQPSQYRVARSQQVCFSNRSATGKSGSMASMESGYNQFCSIAKASEVLAQRWTPLILRELMADVRTFNDIQRGVPLISRAVLVARLRDLERQGIIER